MNPKNLGRESENALDTALSFLYQAETPEGFETSWRAAIRREERIRMKNGHAHPFWRVALPSLAAVVLVIGTLITGASDPGKSNSTSSVELAESARYSTQEGWPFSDDSNYGAEMESANYDMPVPMEGGMGASGASMVAEAGDTALSADKKIVRTADMRLATATFEESEKILRDRVAAANGTIESMYQYGDGTRDNLRTLTLTLRIPTERLDEFLAGASAIGRVTVKSESARDMTVQYTETSLELQTQRDKMTRLQELLLKAETVADLLQIENEIANTQYRIESFETSLRSIDRDVAASTVTVTLTEETPAQSAAAPAVSLGERIASGLRATLAGLGQFFQNMLVFIVMALPVALPLALIGAVIWLAVRVRRKSKREETN